MDTASLIASVKSSQTQSHGETRKHFSAGLYFQSPVPSSGQDEEDPSPSLQSTPTNESSENPTKSILWKTAIGEAREIVKNGKRQDIETFGSPSDKGGQEEVDAALRTASAGHAVYAQYEEPRAPKEGAGEAMYQVPTDSNFPCSSLPGPMTALSMSADASVVAVADPIRARTYIMDTLLGSHSFVFENTKFAALSACGKLLAVAGTDSTVIVRNLDECTIAGQMKVDDRITALAMSPDGRCFAAASSAQEVFVKILGDQGEPLSLQIGEHVQMLCLSVSVGEKRKYRLATVSPGGNVRVLDITPNETPSWKQVGVMQHLGVTCAALSSNGKFLVTGGKDCTTIVFEIEEQQMLSRLTHNDVVSCVAIVADGGDGWQASLSVKNRILKFSAANSIAEAFQMKEDIAVFAVSADRRFTAGCTTGFTGFRLDSGGGCVRTGWQLSSLLPLENMKSQVHMQDATGTRVLYEPKKRHCDVLDGESKVLWGFSSEKEYSHIEWFLGTPGKGDTYVLYVVKTQPKTVIVYDVESKQEIHSITGEEDITFLACQKYSPIAMVQRRGTKYELLAFMDNEVCETFEDTEQWVISGNSKRAAFLLDDARVRVRDFPSKATVAIIECDAARGMGLSHDGGLLFTSDLDQAAQIWNVDAGECLFQTTIADFELDQDAAVSSRYLAYLCEGRSQWNILNWRDSTGCSFTFKETGNAQLKGFDASGCAIACQDAKGYVRVRDLTKPFTSQFHILAEGDSSSGSVPRPARKTAKSTRHSSSGPIERKRANSPLHNLSPGQQLLIHGSCEYKCQSEVFDLEIACNASRFVVNSWLQAKKCDMVEVFETGSGKVLFSWTLQESQGVVNCATVSKDGKLVAIGHQTKVTVWDIDTSSELVVIDHTNAGSSEHAMFAPDSSFIITVSSDCEVRTTDLQNVNHPTIHTFKTETTNEDGEQVMPAAQFWVSDDLTRMSFECESEGIHVYDFVKEGNKREWVQKCKIPDKEGQFCSHAMSHDKQFLALAENNSVVVKIRSIEDDLPYSSLKYDTKQSFVLFTPNSDAVASFGMDRCFRIKHLLSGSTLFHVDLGDVAERVARNGAGIYCYSIKNVVKMLNFPAPKDILESKQDQSYDRTDLSLLLLPQQTSYLSYSQAEATPLQIRDLHTQQCLRPVPLEISDMAPIESSNDGKALLLRNDKSVLVKSLVDRRTVFTYTAPLGACIRQAGISGNCKLLAIVVETLHVDSKLLVIDLLESVLLYSKPSKLETAVCVALSPDDATLVCSQDKHIAVMKARSGEVMFSYGHADTVCTISFSPCGYFVATAGRGQRVLVYNLVSHVASPPLDAVVTGATWIRAVCFTADSKTVLLTYDDSTVALRRLSDESTLFSFKIADEKAPNVFASTDATLIGYVFNQKLRVFSISKLVRFGPDLQMVVKQVQRGYRVFSSQLVGKFANALALQSSKYKRTEVEDGEEKQSRATSHGRQGTEVSNERRHRPNRGGKDRRTSTEAAHAAIEADRILSSGIAMRDSESPPCDEGGCLSTLAAICVEENAVMELEELVRWCPAAAVYAHGVAEDPLSLALRLNNRKAIRVLLNAVVLLPKTPGWNLALHQALRPMCGVLSQLTGKNEDLLLSFLHQLQAEGTVTVPVDLKDAGYQFRRSENITRDVCKASEYARISKGDPVRDIWSKELTKDGHGVVAHMLLLPGLVNLDFIRALVEDCKSIEVFDNPTVRILVQVTWNQARGGFVADAALYGLFAVLFTMSASLCVSPDFETAEGGGKWLAGVVCGAFAQLASLFFFCREARELHAVGLKNYFKSPWNVLASNTHTLVLVTFIMIISKSVEEQTLRAITSIVLLEVWLLFLFFLRGFDAYSYLIQMLLAIAADIIPFLVITAVVVIGFCSAFFVLLGQPEGNWRGWDSSLGTVLLASVLGEFGMDEFQVESEMLSWIASFMFAGMGFVINLVALNALIAIMTSSHERVTGKKLPERYKNHASLVVEFMQLLSPKHLEDMQAQHYWIHILSPSSDGVAHENSGEIWDGREENAWSGQVDALKRVVRRAQVETEEKTTAAVRRILKEELQPIVNTLRMQSALRQMK